MSLPRERLTALLSESALTSVELVVAPPGYGKTTVLREYTAGDPSADQRRCGRAFTFAAQAVPQDTRK